MSKSPAISKDLQKEIAFLVRQLHETQERLKELTGGEVDAVLHPTGHSYLLHEAQEQLQFSESAQRQVAETQVGILNALPAHIALIDAKGTIISTNEAWRRFATENALHGSAFAMGENYLDVCERAMGNCSEEAKATATGIRRVLNNEATDFTMEYPCHSPTEQRWFFLRVTPVHKAESAGAVVMHINITERKLAEEALRASEGAMAEGQRIAHLGSWELELTNLEGTDSNALRWSDEMFRIAGLQPKSIEVSNELFFSLVPIEEHELIRAAVANAIQKKGQYSIIHRFIRPGGDVRVVHELAQIVTDDTGRPSKLVGTAHDITELKKTEQQLLWKTALFEAQVNSSLDGIIVVDSAGQKVLQNQQMVDIWSIPTEFAEESDHKRRLKWIKGQVKEPESFMAKVKHLYAHPEEVSRDELSLLNGKYIDRYTAPVVGRDGKYYGRIWSYRDITERKLADEQLRLREEQLRLYTEYSPAAIAMFDRDMKYLVVSRGWMEAYHLGEKSIIGLSHYQVFPEIPSRWKEIYRRCLKGAVEKCEEDPFPLADGTESWLRWEVRPWRRADDSIGGLVMFSEDITKRKQAEDAKRTTEARFRLLVDSNAQGVIFWNTKGEITGANDAFLNLVHQTREELEAGKINWMALTPPEHAHLDQKALEQLADTGTCDLYEKEFVLKDGTRIPILLGAAVFKDTPSEGVCFILDLSERKKLEQQFLRAQRMESIGTLAGGIAHDLNNILAPIMMSIDVLKLTAKDPQAKSILETIELSAQRGANIVRQVLSFARGVEGERIEVQPELLVAELENIIKDTFPKNIRLHFSIPKEPWLILGDPTQIHQILLNLCVNARDAMPHGGTLSVNLENCVLDDHYVAMNLQAKAGRYVQIGVADTGTGMPPDVLNKIFEPFFTTKGLNEGTGLGLSTVMAIVKSHGGNVNVYSEQGKGTTFMVYLPAAEISFGSAKKQLPDLSLPQGNGETILVVDDEASILSITTQTLTAFGYRVLGATDGAEAIALYAENKKNIALVLTDMAMPIMDGAAVIRALLRINPSVNIIAASGLKLTSDSVQVPRGGIQTFLMKPYTSATLLKAIHSLLPKP